MFNNGLESMLWVHLLQLTIGIALIGAVVRFGGRRWPQVTFLLCMLALAKCLVPPLITSPAGLFTRSEKLAFSPEMTAVDESDVIRWKQLGTFWEPATTSGNSLDAWSSYTAAPLNAAWDILIRKPAWVSLCLMLWCSGALFVLLRGLRQAWRLRSTLRRMSPADQRVHWLCCEIKHQLGLRRAVRVIVSEQNYGPACVGFFRPSLVLPRILTDRFPDRLLRPIIAHELIHARRGDIFWGYIQFLAQLVWWFHPLVWWMSKRANDLCERCCDLEVIRSRQCGASDYAESLVRVLELKSSLHAMPLAHSMAPRQITRLRLEAIMKFCERTAPSRNSFLSWLLVAGLGLLLLPGMHWARAQHENDSEIEYRLLGEQEAKRTVNRAMQMGDWDTVVKVLQPVVEREPENPGATFYLGFALHAQGKYEDALVYHARAADFDSTRSLALYNWACCLALLGRSELALDKLGAALDAGFVARIDVADDPDFQSLTDNPRFQELRRRQLDYRQLDFLAGEWTLQDSTGQILSEHRFRFDEKGHLLKEEWTTDEGGSGSSMLYFHPEDRVWKQTRIRDDGSVAEYVAELGSSQLEFRGKVCSKSGSTLKRKVSLVQSSPTEIEHLVEQSTDEGKSWQTVQVGKLVMKSSLGKPLDTTARQQFFMVSPTEDKLQ